MEQGPKFSGSPLHAPGSKLAAPCFPSCVEIFTFRRLAEGAGCALLAVVRTTMKR